MLGRKRFQHDVVIVLVDDSSRPLVDFEVLSEPPWNHDLPLYGE